MAPAGRAVEIVSSALGDQVGVVGAAAIVYDRAECRGEVVIEALAAALAEHVAAPDSLDALLPEVDDVGGRLVERLRRRRTAVHASGTAAAPPTRSISPRSSSARF